MGQCVLARLLSGVAIVLVASAGCRDKDPQAREPGLASPRADHDAKVASVDAALPRLAPDRETFWARYLGAPGVPGPDMLAFCRDAKPTAITDIAPGATLEKQSTDWCQLVIQSPEMVDEARLVLQRWSQRAEDKFLDPEHQLSAFASSGPERVTVG